MTRRFSISSIVALALISYVSSAARASVTFTYDWSPSVPFLSGAQGMNALDFTSQGPITVTTDKAVGAAASISIDNANSDTFINRGFNLAVQITDGAWSDTRSFSGMFTGTITNGVPNSLSVVYTTPTTLPLTAANGDQFTVKLTGFVSPNAFGPSSKPGALGFEIDAIDGNGQEPPPNDMPEPTTLLLSCLGAGGLALRAWAKRASRA
jgi:hypothetical protein